MYEYVDLQGGDIKYNHGYYIRGREILLSLVCTYSMYTFRKYALLDTFALISSLTDSTIINIFIIIFPIFGVLRLNFLKIVN
jgi:hypothetical protein